MARKKYKDIVDENNPLIREARASLNQNLPVGNWLYVLGYSDYTIQHLLKDAKKNGLMKACTVIEDELCSTFKEAQDWHDEFKKKKLSKKS